MKDLFSMCYFKDPTGSLFEEFEALVNVDRFSNCNCSVASKTDCFYWQ